MTNTATVLDQLAACEAAIEQLGDVNSDAEGIEALRRLESLKARIAAQQIKVTAQTETHRHAADAELKIAKSRRGVGLGAEIGLARMQSPSRGAEQLKYAGQFLRDLPHTFAALSAGQLTEETATVVARETHWLSPKHRARADELIKDRLTAGLGPRQLGNEVRAHAYSLDPDGAVQRHTKAQAQRRVWVRPASEGMAAYSILLPLHTAVSALAQVRRQAMDIINSGRDDDTEPRTLDQVMADLSVELLTGQTDASDVPAEVQLVMTDSALFGDDDTSAWITGYGPMPIGIAKQWLATTQGNVMLRRVFTRPSDGQLVQLESRSRSFPKGLRQMVLLRDRGCRTPYCDAPIKEIDHIQAVQHGGPTAWHNASGHCSACNQTKETTGWRHTAVAEGLEVTTRTGHTYISRDGPPLPGKPPDGSPDADASGADPPLTAPPVAFRRRDPSALTVTMVLRNAA